MNQKHQRFVVEYLKDLNATQAAIRAGYSKKTAGAQGSRLLTNAEIASAVQVKASEQLEKAELSAVRVLEEYRRIAFMDARGFWDADGNLKPIQDLTAEQGSALAGFEAVIKNAKAGDGVTDTVHKIKLVDKVRPLEALAKHFGLLEDKVSLTGDLVIRWE